MCITCDPLADASRSQMGNRARLPEISRKIRCLRQSRRVRDAGSVPWGEAGAERVCITCGALQGSAWRDDGRDDLAARPRTLHVIKRIEALHAQGIVAIYNCSKCPGYCCSYPVIPLKKHDVERLAAHFGLGFKEARKKFTKVEGEEPYAMRRKDDVHFGRICRFFDTQKRG